MTYKLDFVVDAAKEWTKLDNSMRRQFAKKLKERLEHPHVPAAQLHNMKDCYKIKLRSVGYRLVYRVKEDIVTVIVIAVGKRDGDEVYEDAKARR
jgi:mRNA interferase RelE/StbE